MKKSKTADQSPVRLFSYLGFFWGVGGECISISMTLCKHSQYLSHRRHWVVLPFRTKHGVPAPGLPSRVPLSAGQVQTRVDMEP